MLPTIFMPAFDAAQVERLMSRSPISQPRADRRISLERPVLRRPSLEHDSLTELRKSA